ncbi:MAG TPA: 50S ribosomal protein L10 [Thermoleophilaceae bacterium]|nr:50S ribosomal protein L10 [Thermoleophilaceae bacterium]
MNREQKAERVAEIATAIKESEAVFAVDYRGISVPQAAELRSKLIEAGARFSVVKNTLTERAADEAGADTLKELLEGPTAFTFVSAEGDVAMAAKALSQFRRANEVLEFKGGVMSGEALTIEQIESLARLPAIDVLHGQMVGVLASPITGLVRGLNQLIAGLAIALGQIQAEGKVGGDEEPPPPEDGPDAGEDAETPAEEAPGDPVAEGETAEEEGETAEEEAPAEPETETETEEAPSEGEEKEG